MASPTPGILSKALGRFTKLHLLLLALTVTILVLSFAPLPINSSISCISKPPSRPHQPYISFKTETDSTLKEQSLVSKTHPSREYDGSFSFYPGHFHRLGDSENFPQCRRH